MSPEQTIWMLSTIGALLFVAVGFLGARAVQVREGPKVAGTVEPPPAPSADRALEQELFRTRQELRSVVEDRERWRARASAMETDLAESVRAASELEAEVALLQRRQRERDAIERQVAELELERATLEGRLRADEVLELRVAELEERLSRIREECSALRDEKSVLASALEDAERRAADAAAADELEQRIEDLELELASSRTKLSELDRLRGENTLLRAAMTERAALRAEVTRLEEEQTRLRALVFAQPESAPELPPAPSSPGAFEKIVHELARTASVRAVAIADELGFTIAGVGSEQEGLAALAGLLGEIERRAQLLLPVGSVRRITLEMDHGAGVSVCPVARAETRIAVATLTVGPRPETVSLSGAIEKAGELLFR